ncbi:DUF2127 domain-containing protein [Microbacterium sp. NPDC057650]|uniref:DUF2127 domain-containing protein n=1 Tax=unclassified Microbacterium TaxID=2609290 RepID=UPI00366FB8B2
MRSRESSARRDLVLDWVFLIGLLFKALDGLLELLVGIPALFITHVQLTSLVRALTSGELAEDPHDLIANLILHESARLATGTLLIGGIYLIVHGAVKVAIVVALLLGSKRIYPWAVGALTILLIVQLVDLVLAFSVGVLVLTVLDAVIIWLTVREWREGRSLHDVIRLRMPWLARNRA